MSEPVVYVAVDRAGQPLYIGATHDLNRRLAEHRARAPWWPLAIEVEEYPQPSWELALYVERNLIRRLSPEFNHQSCDEGLQAINAAFGPFRRSIAGLMA